MKKWEGYIFIQTDQPNCDLMLRASLHKRYWDRGSKQAVRLHFTQIRKCVKLYQIKKYPRAVSNILVQSFSACAFSRIVVANA